jgi:hypothetical protein
VEGLSAPGKGYVDMSTVDDATSREIGAAVAAKGGRFLEVRCCCGSGVASLPRAVPCDGARVRRLLARRVLQSPPCVAWLGC